MATFALLNEQNKIDHLSFAVTAEELTEFGYTLDKIVEIDEANPPKAVQVYDPVTKTFVFENVTDPNKVIDHEVNFMTLFSAADLAAIYTNAAANIQTAIMLDKLRTSNMIFMSADPEISTWLDALVEAGVLSAKPVI
ncbi:MAG: hypothetical protein QXN55_01625 [Candidatus Nitrosotenuis sp.]